MADPTDLFAYDELVARLKQPLRIALVHEAELLQTMDIVYRRTDEIASIAHEVREELRDGDIDISQLAIDEGSPDAPVIRLIQTMFQDAVQGTRVRRAHRAGRERAARPPARRRRAAGAEHRRPPRRRARWSRA